ncbi:MAG: hypothetical protein CM15mP83_1300 [Flavobacteriaceae bacterium]|nr:MAG: hypothetical protein CM15mP83_1300 [Flavobacteriaceae bacterium]
MQNQEPLAFGNDKDMFMFVKRKKNLIFLEALFCQSKYYRNTPVLCGIPCRISLGTNDEISIDVGELRKTATK